MHFANQCEFVANATTRRKLQSCVLFCENAKINRKIHVIEHVTSENNNIMKNCKNCKFATLPWKQVFMFSSSSAQKSLFFRCQSSRFFEKLSLSFWVSSFLIYSYVAPPSFFASSFWLANIFREYFLPKSWRKCCLRRQQINELFSDRRRRPTRPRSCKTAAAAVSWRQPHRFQVWKQQQHQIRKSQLSDGRPKLAKKLQQQQQRRDSEQFAVTFQSLELAVLEKRKTRAISTTWKAFQKGASLLE